MSVFSKALLTKPLVLAVVAVLIVASWYFFFQRGGSEEATFTIRSGDFIETVNLSGTVVAASRADLGFAESGRISGVYAKVGDTVYAGALLAAIENGDLVAAIAQKEAALETERAKLLSLQNGTRPEEVALSEAAVTQDENVLRDSVKSAYVSADDAIHKKADQFFTNPRTYLAALNFSISDGTLKNRVEQERAALETELALWGASLSATSFTTGAPEAESAKAKLHLTHVATFLTDASEALSLALPTNTTYQADINTARTTIANDLSALTTAEGALIDARGDLLLAKAGATAADTAAQAAQVKAAEANVLSAKAAVAKTVVTAPFSGVVSKMDIKKGEIVSANTSAIALLSKGAFEVETYVPQINVAAVSVGDKAAVTLDAYGSQAAFTAHVASIDPAETVRDGVATYKTTIAFDTTDERIRSGMTANVIVTTNNKVGAIVIPKGAITVEGGQSFVRVVGEEAPRSVTTGVTSSLGQIEIVEGLHDGDVILLTP